MADGVSIEIRGIDDLKKRIGDPDKLAKVVSRLTKEAAKAGQQAAFQSLQGRGTGLAARSVSMGPDKFNPMSHRVFTQMAQTRSESIDQGRPPGTSLPLVVVARWLFNRTGLRSLGGLSPSERAMAVEARAAILSGGSKAVAFKEEGRKAAEEKLDSLMRSAGDELVRELSR